MTGPLWVLLIVMALSGEAQKLQPLADGRDKCERDMGEITLMPATKGSETECIQQPRWAK